MLRSGVSSLFWNCMGDNDMGRIAAFGGSGLWAAMLLLAGMGGWGCGPVPTSEPLGTGDLQARLNDLRSAAEARPGDAPAQAALGMAYYLLDRPEEAWDPLERSLELDPDQTTLTLVLAEVHRRGGRYDRAEALLNDVPLRAESDRVLVESARERVGHARLVEESRAMLGRSAPVDEGSLSDGLLAVFTFSTDGADRSTEGLGTAVSFLVGRDLDRPGAVDVVERARQQALTVGAKSAPVRQEKEEAPPLDPVTTTRGLQQRLQLLTDDQDKPFYGGKLDGVAGPGTSNAVKSFQASMGLQADGIAGPKTRSTLEEAVQQRYWVAPPAARESATSDLARMLGARRMVEGRVWRDVSADGASARLNARAEVKDVVDGAILATAVSEAVDAEAYSVPASLAEQILEILAPGWENAPVADDAVAEAPKQTKWYETAPSEGSTDSGGSDTGFSGTSASGSKLDALNEFGLGLLAEDRDDWEGAAAHYRRAVEMDPGFGEARSRLDVVAIAGGEFQDRIHRVARSLLGS